MANNQFLVSVAEAIIRDPNTLEALAYGKANITSAFTLSMQKTDVRGGINNPLLFAYMHDRAVDIKIEEAVFNTTILSINAGTSVLNQSFSVLKTECIVLSSGSGTLTETPTGNVSVVLENGLISTVTPAGTAIYVPGGGSQRIDAIYVYSDTADRVIVEAITPPSVVDLTLIAQVRDNTGVIVDYLQIEIPRYQVSGNYTLSLAANGVSTQALDGTALVTAATDCSGGDYFATVTWVPAGSAAVAVADIAITPSSVSLASLATRQLTVLGIRGGTYANTIITTSSSFVRTSGCAGITVSAAGLITATSAVAAGDAATIRAAYYDATSGSLFDYVVTTVV